MVTTDGAADGWLIAPLDEITALAKKYGALVHIDECHATGFLGTTGRGSAEVKGVLDKIDISPAPGQGDGGALGGFSPPPGAKRSNCCANVRALPVPSNRCRTRGGGRIKAFEMLSAPANCANACARTPPISCERMTAAGFDIKPGVHPISLVMLYDAPLAQRFAERLLEEGIYAIGFFFPVVAKGRARIRTQMSAAHARAPGPQRSTRSPASARNWASWKATGRPPLRRHIFDLRRGQLAPLPFRQVAELQRADGDAYEPQHADVERRQQAPDLPVAAFVQHDFQPGVLSPARSRIAGFRLEPCAFAFDAIAHRSAIRRRRKCGRPARGRSCPARIAGSVRRGGPPWWVVRRQQQAFAGLCRGGPTGAIQPEARSIRSSDRPCRGRGSSRAVVTQAARLAEHQVATRCRGRIEVRSIDVDAGDAVDGGELRIADDAAIDAHRARRGSIRPPCV